MTDRERAHALDNHELQRHQSQRLFGRGQQGMEGKGGWVGVGGGGTMLSQLLPGRKHPFERWGRGGGGLGPERGLM